MNDTDTGADIDALSNQEQPVYRTFFITDSSSAVIDRATFKDVSEELAAARVRARMDGKELTYTELVQHFGDAVLSANAKLRMTRRVATADHSAETRGSLRGPFDVLTKFVPAAEWLQAWARNRQHSEHR